MLNRREALKAAMGIVVSSAIPMGRPATEMTDGDEELLQFVPIEADMETFCRNLVDLEAAYWKCLNEWIREKFAAELQWKKQTAESA